MVIPCTDNDYEVGKGLYKPALANKTSLKLKCGYKFPKENSAYNCKKCDVNDFCAASTTVTADTISTGPLILTNFTMMNSSITTLNKSNVPPLVSTYAQCGYTYTKVKTRR